MGSEAMSVSDPTTYRSTAYSRLHLSIVARNLGEASGPNRVAAHNGSSLMSLGSRRVCTFIW